MNIKKRIEESSRNYKFFNCRDTSEILYSLINMKIVRNGRKIDWFYEFPQSFEKNIHLLFGRLIPKSSISENENKDKYLELVIREFDKMKNSIIPRIVARQKRVINHLKYSGYESKNFVLLCPWRLVIGLGSSHPQETSMTFHHIYGIPYIPGSAIKGVTRYWLLLKIYEEIGLTYFGQIKSLENILESAELNNKDERLDEWDFEKKFRVEEIKRDRDETSLKFYDFLKQRQDCIKEFQNIFGTQNHKGEIIFFDAYPIEEVNLKVDIINPHYSSYYDGKEPPADWQDPVPIKFLTVENTKFLFHLASKENNLLQKAENYLKEAVKEYGIGAKTSLGYGIFREE
ncbi:MAG: type III-B CRISPR module RAMP protein Cmr6 [Candidatus Marinimicrobia bacterium]|nr:type III-B CRISPR module RAMP protein Cmr6 [Candidatus Neomarinimicrobiota bacterium]